MKRIIKAPFILSCILLTCVTLAAQATDSARANPSQGTKDVVFGELKTFAAPNGWFSMTVPTNWKVTDKSTQQETIITIIDPTENGVVIVRVWPRAGEMTQDEKMAMVRKFLDGTMASFPNFAMTESSPQTKDRVGVTFKYDSAVDAGTFPMYGGTFFQYNGDLAGLVSWILPKEQYDKKKESMTKVLDSFKLIVRAPRAQ